MTIWLQITRDEYELPVVVAESAKELARLTGTTENSIRSAITKAARRGNRCKYVKVEVDDQDE